jgi:hypothetical protein
MQECPDPFVRDPLAQNGSTATLDATFCRYGCCIPCPAQNLVSFLTTVVTINILLTHTVIINLVL